MGVFIQFILGVILFFGAWIITTMFVEENMTLGLVVGISVLWIYIFLVKNINDRQLRISGKYWFIFRGNRSEARLKKKLLKIAKDVEKQGLHELIPNLYYNAILHYPELLKTNRDQIPSLVESVNIVYEEARKDSTIKRAIEIVLFKKHYKFIEHTDGLLELFDDEKRVFAINTKLNSLLAYKDGLWIHDFKQFEKEITLETKEDVKKLDKAIHTKLIRSAKENFDID